MCNPDCKPSLKAWPTGENPAELACLLSSAQSFSSQCAGALFGAIQNIGFNQVFSPIHLTQY